VAVQERVVGVDVNKLAQALDRARARKRQADRMVKRVLEMVEGLGLHEVCLDGVKAKPNYIEYKSLEALQRLHDILAEVRYYTDLLADARELEEFLDPEARELLDRAEEYREHLKEMIRCR